MGDIVDDFLNDKGAFASAKKEASSEDVDAFLADKSSVSNPRNEEISALSPSQSLLLRAKSRLGDFLEPGVTAKQPDENIKPQWSDLPGRLGQWAAEQATSPVNLALAGAGPAIKQGSALGRTIAGGFGAMGLKQSFQGAGDLAKFLMYPQEKTPEGALRAGGELGAILMATAGAHGAMERSSPAPVQTPAAKPANVVTEVDSKNVSPNQIAGAPAIPTDIPEAPPTINPTLPANDKLVAPPKEVKVKKVKPAPIGVHEAVLEQNDPEGLNYLQSAKEAGELTDQEYRDQVERSANASLEAVPSPSDASEGQMATQIPPEPSDGLKTPQKAPSVDSGEVPELARYTELASKMSQMVKEKTMVDPKTGEYTPEFKSIWQELEDIKNRNKGMPPGQESGRAFEPKPEQLTEQSQQQPIQQTQNIPSIKWDAKNGLGAVPYNQDVGYRGFVKSMTPAEFRSLVPEGVSGDKSKAIITKAINNGESLGQPFLQVSWDKDSGAWKVKGHEGRSRADAIADINPDEPIPVHIIPRDYRAKDLTPEMRSAGFIPQEKEGVVNITPKSDAVSLKKSGQIPLGEPPGNGQAVGQDNQVLPKPARPRKAAPRQKEVGAGVPTSSKNAGFIINPFGKKAGEINDISSDSVPTHVMYVNHPDGTIEVSGVTARKSIDTVDAEGKPYSLPDPDGVNEVLHVRRKLSELRNILPAPVFQKIAQGLGHEIDLLSGHAAHQVETPSIDWRGKSPMASEAGAILNPFSDLANKARERILARQKEGRSLMGIDPADFADHVIVGADLIAKGIADKVKWSGRMIREFGDRVRPYLDHIYEQAKSMAANEPRAKDALARDTTEKTLQEAESQPLENQKLNRSLGVRLNTLDRLGQSIGNQTKQVTDFFKRAGGSTLFRDVVMDIMDNNQNGKGAITRIFGRRIDQAYNERENILRSFREPLKQVLKDHPLDSKSMERVNIHAIAQEDGGLERLAQSGVDASTVKQVSESLTPGEQSFYNAARKVLDEQVYPQVSKFMKDNYKVDVKKVKNYWPLQRDWSTWEGPPKAPEPNVTKGEEKPYDELYKGMMLQHDFLPNRSTKTKQGFTIERVPDAKGQINLRQNVIESHLKDAAHLLAFQKDLKDLGQIARKDWFAEKYGHLGQQYILDWLDTVARDGGMAGGRRIAWLDWFTKNTSVGILGARLFSQFKHASNVVFAIRHVDKDMLFNAIPEAWSQKGSEFMKKNFNEVFNRSGGETAIDDLIKGNKFRKAQASTFVLENMLDRGIARGATLAKYMEGLAKKGKDPFAYAELPLDQDAWHDAILTSRKITTSPLAKDVPQAISRGKLTAGNLSLARAVFQFQTTMMRLAGYAKHEIVDLGFKQGDLKQITMATITMMGVIAATTAITKGNKAFAQKFLGQKPSKDDPSFGQEMGLEGIRILPGGTMASGAITHGQTGVPLVDNTLSGTTAAGRLITNKNKYGTRLSGVLRTQAQEQLRDSALSALGVPVTPFHWLQGLAGDK